MLATSSSTVTSTTWLRIDPPGAGDLVTNAVRAFRVDFGDLDERSVLGEQPAMPAPMPSPPPVDDQPVRRAADSDIDAWDATVWRAGQFSTVTGHSNGRIGPETGVPSSGNSRSALSGFGVPISSTRSILLRSSASTIWLIHS